MKRVTNPNKYRCDECGSTKLTKNGMAVSGRKKIQRWLCGKCYKLVLHPKKG